MALENLGYAGDLDAAAAWSVLETDPRAVLVDVRTLAEWTFVGVPDLGGVGKTPVLIEWQRYPAMERTPDFEAVLSAELETRGAGRDAPVLFLCRSGVRSRSAAIALAGLGYTACHNVAGGFEGPLDAAGHRGTAGGWKAAGLPWVQS
ncbi:rhodanese-like domain-containing protein [Methylobrevis pamukkalensis]|uniref:Molybdopterin biosynthesis protein MoeB n=1 Tax=Methylobrevis pamukkalensis TaxID=1439726 RepID=A0A1E3GN71_9HYPH|nr:rhodanese-like domain-containing protein [Methylobrevis pamukkalensis]ODN65502.1 molybdopterin biosynthesis protein MoeB [Methylobrevis pamukkalensis]